MFKEVVLAALTVVHRVPCGEGKLLAEAAIACVGQTCVGGGSPEGFDVIVVELNHELFGESLSSGERGEDGNKEEILDSNQEKAHQDPVIVRAIHRRGEVFHADNLHFLLFFF